MPAEKAAPTGGDFPWEIAGGAAALLIVGSAGLSTWRFQATLPGQGRLLLQYQRPWEQGVAPALIYDCAVHVD